MLKKNNPQPKQFKDYKFFCNKSLVQKIEKQAKTLKGLKVIHINATPDGGGVAELLKSLVPLMNSVGLDAEWYSLKANTEFFEITKKIQNALQNGRGKLTEKEKNLYLEYNKRLAIFTKKLKADIWVIHDPQPMPIAFMNPKIYPAIWQCHIDTSRPSRPVWNFLKPFLEGYDRIIFTMPDFAQSHSSAVKKVFFPPAIDPLSETNLPMTQDEAKRIMHDCGIKIEKPVITQVSRFDQHKDPIGVIKAFIIAKQKISDLQLALLGIPIAKDDPESAAVFAEVKKYARNFKDIHLFYNIKNMDISVEKLVNAFQTGSDIILQKSKKEGFGLTVAEAMYKKKPVIGGNTGGIKLQIQDGKNGFLVDTPQECAKRIVEILLNPKLADKLGVAAKKSVESDFLMPRLLNDYLNLFQGLKKGK